MEKQSLYWNRNVEPFSQKVYISLGEVGMMLTMIVRWGHTFDPSQYLNQGWIIVSWTRKNLSKIWNKKPRVFWFNKIYFKMSSAKCRPFCSGLNVLINDDDMTVKGDISGGLYNVTSVFQV